MMLPMAPPNTLENTMDNVDNMDLKKMAADVQKRQGEVEDREDQMYGQAVKGKFSGKGLNALVQATNRLLPLFGIKDAYPSFGPSALTQLPPDFARLLSMFSKAIDDAVEGGILPPESLIDLSIVTDDNGLQSLSGRINMAAKASGFKRFLMTKTKDVPESPTEDTSYEAGITGTQAHAAEEMSEEGTDKLFKSRM